MQIHKKPVDKNGIWWMQMVENRMDIEIPFDSLTTYLLLSFSLKTSKWGRFEMFSLLSKQVNKMKISKWVKIYFRKGESKIIGYHQSMNVHKFHIFIPFTVF